MRISENFREFENEHTPLTCRNAKKETLACRTLEVSRPPASGPPVPQRQVPLFPSFRSPRPPASGPPVPQLQVPPSPSVRSPRPPASGPPVPQRQVPLFPSIRSPCPPASGPPVPQRQVPPSPSIRSPCCPASGPSAARGVWVNLVLSCGTLEQVRVQSARGRGPHAPPGHP